jgi:hypothetical protein
MVEVKARSWGVAPDEKLPLLLQEVTDWRPDYLLLHPPPAWVSLPLVEIAIRRRLPRRWRGGLDRLSRLTRRLELRLGTSRWPWLLSIYRKPLSVLGERLFGAETQFTVDEASAHLEWLISVAKRAESTGILVLKSLSVNPERSLSRRPSWADAVEQEFLDTIRKLCAEHHAMLVDIGVGNESIRGNLLLADGLHSTPERKRRQAEIVAAVIADLESAYELPEKEADLTTT